MKELRKIKTLGELKASGYQSISIKEELRNNLIQKLKGGETVFVGIWGFEETVIPDLERAILSMHDINLLGLRGQAKTRLARLMVDLLDEYIPVIKGSELNDDPFKPLSRFAKDLISEKGDETPVEWMHRAMRFLTQTVLLILVNNDRIAFPIKVCATIPAPSCSPSYTSSILPVMDGITP